MSSTQITRQCVFLGPSLLLQSNRKVQNQQTSTRELGGGVICQLTAELDQHERRLKAPWAKKLQRNIQDMGARFAGRVQYVSLHLFGPDRPPETAPASSSKSNRILWPQDSLLSLRSFQILIVFMFLWASAVYRHRMIQLGTVGEQLRTGGIFSHFQAESELEGQWVCGDGQIEEKRWRKQLCSRRERLRKLKCCTGLWGMLECGSGEYLSILECVCVCERGQPEPIICPTAARRPDNRRRT